MVDGVVQDWGLVEFASEEDAELSREATNGFILKGSKLRVHFCVPGVSAMSIYMQVRFSF